MAVIFSISHVYSLVFVFFMTVESTEVHQWNEPTGESLLGRLHSGDEPLTVMWGLADTTATVGKVFHYRLPKDAFRGKVTGYKVPIL